MNNAVQAAVSCNTLGIVICDWSLPGHVNPLSVSIPAFLAGAGLAWKASLDLVSFLFGFSESFVLTELLTFSRILQQVSYFVKFFEIH